MEHTYFGATHVQPRWKYLGIWTGCCKNDHPEPAQWDEDALHTITNQTWRLATHTMLKRCQAVTRTRPAPAMIAQ
eukprot:7956481-Prorocentrum_lima.AAC.1